MKINNWKLYSILHINTKGYELKYSSEIKYIVNVLKINSAAQVMTEQ